MADAIISVVVERVAAIIEEQIRNEINLVRGVEEEIRKLTDELKKVRNVLDDAEQRGYKEKSIKDWLQRLEYTSYEMDDVLDEWEIAILKLKMERDDRSNDDVALAPPKQKVCPSILSSCLCFKKVVVRRDIAKKIQNMKERLDQILAEKDRYSFVMSQRTSESSPRSWRESASFVNLDKVHGREDSKKNLVTKLVANCSNQEELGIHTLSIVGGGGLGKTTLAQLVYNDSRVQEYFELKIWVCVSDLEGVGLAKRIVESMQGTSQTTDQLEILLQTIRNSVSGKRFLLVLDDVWTEKYAKWEPLKNSLECGGVGSKILVTTRNERVAKMMGSKDDGIYHPDHLSGEECWLVLRDIALLGRNEEEFKNFEDIGKKIADKCKGLPLAAKVLGSLLLFKNRVEEWENVLSSKIWQLEEAEVELFPHLLLSYNELSPMLKRCFSYCAIFPKDTLMYERRLIGNWMALGYLGSNVGSAGDMERKGQEYIENLAMRSLFQRSLYDIRYNLMHDVVHDFAQSLRKDRSNERLEAATKKTTCRYCTPLVSRVKEYRSLFWDHGPPPNHLCDCLISVRALEIEGYEWQSIPRGMENLIHLRWLVLKNFYVSQADLKAIFQLYHLQTLELVYCKLKEIPKEIGNLIHLRSLNLSLNEFAELPESICNLHELHTLNVTQCTNLRALPQGIHGLVNLERLFNHGPNTLDQLPQGLAQLTGLRTLSEFRGGSARSKLGLLKNLNLLSGYLCLFIRLSGDLEEVVEDAREAELKKKMHIDTLIICFEDEMDGKEPSPQERMDLMDALEPHPNLRNLQVGYYKGSRLPAWITSPLNKLQEVSLYSNNHLLSLPPLGKLSCLEEISMSELDQLELVGREFLGMDTESSSQTPATNHTIAFPRLKTLSISECPKWKEWEDITAEEEKSAAMSLMPCLTELEIRNCDGLTALPHRLLRKMSSLEVLRVGGSTQLQQRYGNKDGYAWKSISLQNPRLQLK